MRFYTFSLEESGNRSMCVLTLDSETSQVHLICASIATISRGIRRTSPLQRNINPF